MKRSRLLRRLGRWLCRYDIMPARHFFAHRALNLLGNYRPDEVAEARAHLRILDGRDPADVGEES